MLISNLEKKKSNTEQRGNEAEARKPPKDWTKWRKPKKDWRKAEREADEEERLNRNPAAGTQTPGVEL